MVVVTAGLAALFVMWDAFLTRRLLLDGHGHTERTALRSALIRVFGINGGTVGVGAAICVVIALVNLLSRQPEAGLWLGNIVVGALFAWAVYKNSEAI